MFPALVSMLLASRCQLKHSITPTIPSYLPSAHPPLPDAYRHGQEIAHTSYMHFRETKRRQSTVASLGPHGSTTSMLFVSLLHTGEGQDPDPAKLCCSGHGIGRGHSDGGLAFGSERRLSSPIRGIKYLPLA